MSNFYTLLKAILPDAPLLVGVVQSVDVGGCHVLLPGGVSIFARGVAQFGDSVFVRDGLIEGQAPSLSVETIDV